ncbi:mitochondrial PGP phosphatase-domain-containing protein [Phakopsora pachyrhizi]|uniref:Mitochondrial PGP phosphatase-domain-containing protein n=1 Tax=Phakopsora pachyrhizi TaxID=170000 RepID=A0AAV0BVT9_PHAPC|nr:mitochondrial PGP phosphatase-domain-containing protein [Phakopsora pachyrhizi]
MIRKLDGLFTVLSCLITRSRSIIPDLIVKDIRSLDWKNFKQIHKFNGVVIDKDNCITRTNKDELIDELKGSWESCISSFGNLRVLIVSNSIGTIDDPSLIQAEYISKKLKVPVLVHDTKKPSRALSYQIHKYFTNPPFESINQVIYPYSQTEVTRNPNKCCQDHYQATQSVGLNPSSTNLESDLKLLVIGDRFFTDVLLASNMRDHFIKLKKHPASIKTFTSSSNITSSIDVTQEQIFSVLTTNIWESEGLPIKLMRLMERSLYSTILKRSLKSSSLVKPSDGSEVELHSQNYHQRLIRNMISIKDLSIDGYSRTSSLLSKLLTFSDLNNNSLTTIVIKNLTISELKKKLKSIIIKLKMKLSVILTKTLKNLYKLMMISRVFMIIRLKSLNFKRSSKLFLRFGFSLPKAFVQLKSWKEL